MAEFHCVKCDYPVGDLDFDVKNCPKCNHSIFDSFNSNLRQKNLIKYGKDLNPLQEKVVKMVQKEKDPSKILGKIFDATLGDKS